MREMISEEIFIEVVSRVNRYLILMGIFFLIYFVLRTKVDIFLFLLALSNMAFALLSFKHLEVTNRVIVELSRAKVALKEVSEKTSGAPSD